MKDQRKKYRIPIRFVLAMFFLSGFFFDALAQMREQLYHDNVIPEHAVSAAGPDVFLSIYSFHRSQWTGLSNSPKSTGFGVNYKLKSNLIAQLYYGYDAIQSFDNQNVKIGLIYSLGKQNRIRFGLRAGINALSRDQDYLAVDPIDSDPVLDQGAASQTSFDADFSASYIYQGVRLGFGLNNLMESGFSSNGVTSTRSLSFFAQNEFRVNLLGVRNILASVFYKSEFQSIASGVVDVKSVLFVTPKLGLGAGYRHTESVPVILQYKGLISNYPFTVQYSYDVQTGALSNYNGGSHEISFRVNLKNKPVSETEIDIEERQRKSKNVRFL